MSENIITAKEAAKINRMRNLMDELEERAKKEGWLVTVENFSLGLFAAKVNAAEEALFDALNIASSHLGCEAADDAIKAHSDARRARIEAANA